MEIVVAKTAGFCFGVKKAVDTAYEQINMGKKIYTLGPIIHNETVVKDLEDKGATVIENIDDLKNIKSGTVIIRSHGVPKNVYDLLEENHIDYVDTTCPFVKRIHSIVSKAAEEGKTVVIIGNAGHPEVEGIQGWAGEKSYVIESVEQAENFDLPKETEICLVSQTTFNHKKFEELVAIFEKKYYYINVAKTICNATEHSQKEAAEIASKADVMIVIGGAHSSNSRKLYEICKKECDNTYFIQTLDDLSLDVSKPAEIVGITAGASTPNNIIEEVQNYVRHNF